MAEMSRIDWRVSMRRARTSRAINSTATAAPLAPVLDHTWNPPGIERY